MRLLSLVCLCCLPITALAQHRQERPLQIQLNLAGGFLSIAGNAIADATVDDIAVNAWKPGLSVGYHFDNSFFIGYAWYPGMDLTLKEAWTFGAGPNDGNIVLDHQPHAIHALQFRYYPFRIGLYSTLAFMHVGAVDYTMAFRRLDGEMRIGENMYATDLDVTWRSERVRRIGLGIGYQVLLKSGLSFQMGITAPVGLPGIEPVQFNTINLTGDPVLASDLVLAEAHLSNETFYAPIIFEVNIGYNLYNLFKR